MKRGRKIRGEWRALPDGSLIWARPIDPRCHAFAERYRKGETLEQIAATVGLTRERVRQLLVKVGISRFDGGVSVRCLLTARNRMDAIAAKRAARDAKHSSYLGVSPERVRELKEIHGRTLHNNHSPFSAYLDQKRNAGRRGIGWEFNFDTWFAVWQASGRWTERGRGQGYCMARYGDSGPYSPENVYICTVGQNFSDSYLIDYPRRRKSRGALKGVRIHAYKVKNGKRWHVNRPGEPGGRAGFQTREAALAYAAKALRAAA